MEGVWPPSPHAHASSQGNGGCMRWSWCGGFRRAGSVLKILFPLFSQGGHRLWCRWGAAARQKQEAGGGLISFSSHFAFVFVFLCLEVRKSEPLLSIYLFYRKPFILNVFSWFTLVTSIHTYITVTIDYNYCKDLFIWWRVCVSFWWKQNILESDKTVLNAVLCFC